MPGAIIGVTNPHFSHVLAHWPHVLRIGGSARPVPVRKENGADSNASEGADRSQHRSTRAISVDVVGNDGNRSLSDSLLGNDECSTSSYVRPESYEGPSLMKSRISEYRRQDGGRHSYTTEVEASNSSSVTKGVLETLREKMSFRKQDPRSNTPDGKSAQRPHRTRSSSSGHVSAALPAPTSCTLRSQTVRACPSPAYPDWCLRLYAFTDARIQEEADDRCK